MKTCGYCNSEYDDSAVKCPQCGSTLLKHTKGSESAAAEYKRLKEEISNKRKNRSLILGIGAALIILVVVIIIASVVGFVNDPQRAIAKESKELLNQAEQMIDNGEYDSAIGVLNQISTEWEDYSKTDAVRQDAERGILMDEINAYQSSGNYEELVAFIDENVANANSDAEIRAIYKDAAKKCKENALKKIATFMESSDYLGAIQYVDVLGSSMKKDADIKSAYDGAVANYVSAVINEAETFAQAGDYTSARSTLSVAENYIGRTTTLADKIVEINERDVAAQVLALIEKGNYGDAIILLNNNNAIVSGSPDLQTKLSTYTEKYRANVISEAASVYNASGYQAAVSVLNSALKVLPNDSSLTNEKVKYEGLAPVSLLNLDTFYSDYGDDSVWSNKRTVQVMKDKLGNSYENCIEYQYGEKDARDIYVINGEYATFSGTIFVPDHRKSGNDDWSYQDPFYFYIYGDGKLLWRSPKMLSTQYPVDFEVDISGVKELSICWHGGASTWYYEIGLANAWLYKD